MGVLDGSMLFCSSIVGLCAVSAVMGGGLRYGKDPDVGRDMIAIVEARGYTIEEHVVETADGYLLGMFHVPPQHHNASNSQVVLLQHGLLDSSWTWACNFESESLLYMLSDRGFDVWLSNNRGNEYSLRHRSLNPDSDAFWAFSWDEMAAFDLPANIEYVRNATGAAKISYVGHSQGTTQAFGGMSLDEHTASLLEQKVRVQALAHNKPISHDWPGVATSAWYAERVSLFGALAPVAFVNHQTSIILTLLADLHAGDIFELFGLRDFLPGTEVLQKLDPLICSLLPSGCEDLLFLVVGESKNLNTSRMDVYVSETPAGASVQDMIHWAQGVRHDRFQMYDFGSASENEKHYNSPTPPQYPLANITVPTALYSGSHDDLADPQDVTLLLDTLPASTIVFAQETQDVAHLDYTWGVDANTFCYENLIQQIYHHAT